MEFYTTLVKCLAHTVFLESRDTYDPLRVCGGLMAGGDPPAPSAMETTDEAMQAYIKHMPTLLNMQQTSMLPYEQARLQTAQAISDPYQKIEADLFSKYGPSMAKTSNQVNDITGLGNANRDYQILRGPGQQVIDFAQQRAAQLDPEFFSLRKSLGEKEKALVDSINPTGLSGSEREEIARATAQGDVARGTLTAPSNWNAIGNAMNFGQALQQKQANLGQLLGGLNTTAQGLRSGIDPIQTALGRPSMNLGDTKFAGVTNESGGVNQLGGQFLGGIQNYGNTAAQINANRRSGLDTALGVMGSVGGLLGGAGTAKSNGL